MTGYGMLGLAIIVGGSLWCIAGDAELFLTVYSDEAVQRFVPAEDGTCRLDPASLPAFRRGAWIKALDRMVCHGLAMEADGVYVLTDAGMALRNGGF